MPIVPVSDVALRRAAVLIRGGGLVAFPTETVYGLGADAFNPAAVARIFEVKNRPFFDPLIVHISEKNDIHRLASKVPQLAEKLIERFWPGPLTLVLEKDGSVPEIVSAGLKTVAVRLPSNKTALSLIRMSGTPIAAPSANPFGYLSPTLAEHVMSQLGDAVDLILDGGASDIGIESTIIRIDGDEIILLRHGGVPLEEIKHETGRAVRLGTSSGAGPAAPGMLESHYSPSKPLVLTDDISAIDISDPSVGLLLFEKISGLPERKGIEYLSESGDMREAAAALFGALHRLDSDDINIIYAMPVPEQGLGRAIMDRLKKASRGKNKS